MKKSLIHVDFNEMVEQDLVLLSQESTKIDSAGNEISLYEGLQILVYMDDVDEDGNQDKLVAAGVVEKNISTDWSAHVKWCCRIDELGIRHISEMDVTVNQKSIYNESRLSDDAIVVRGGKHDSTILAKSAAEHPSGVKGISVVSADGKSLKELSATVPHQKITTTTVGAVRNSGGDVIPTKGRSPYHATLLIDVTAPLDADANPISEDGMPRVFADFNNTTECGYVRLNTVGAINDIESNNLDLCGGIEIELYDLDEIVVTATVVYHEADGWVAEIDWSKLP